MGNSPSKRYKIVYLKPRTHREVQELLDLLPARSFDELIRVLIAVFRDHASEKGTSLIELFLDVRDRLRSNAT